jgi:hypothetical protein
MEINFRFGFAFLEAFFRNVMNHKLIKIWCTCELVESIIQCQGYHWNRNLPHCFYFYFAIWLCLLCRYSRSLALYISTLCCYVKLPRKNGYLRNSRILGTWNLDLQRSNLRMITLLSFQVFLLLVLLASGSLLHVDL